MAQKKYSIKLGRFQHLMSERRADREFTIATLSPCLQDEYICAKQKQHGGRHAARTGLRIPRGFEPVKEKARQHMSPGRMLAERVGFEPTVP